LPRPAEDGGGVAAARDGRPLGRLVRRGATIEIHLKEMAKCDPWACFAQLTGRSDGTQTLMNEREKYAALAREAMRAIAALESAKMDFVRANNKPAAVQCMRDRRKKELQLNKYNQMADFCQMTLERVRDIASVNETMAALGEVKRTYGHMKMDELYEKFGTTVQDVAAGNDALQDVNSLIATHGRVAAPFDDIDEAALEAEFAALEAQMLQQPSPSYATATSPVSNQAAPQQQNFGGAAPTGALTKPPLPIAFAGKSSVGAAEQTIGGAYAAVGVKLQTIS